MLCSDFSDEKTSWNSQTTKCAFVKSIRSSMRQTVLGSPDRSVAWSDGEAGGLKFFVGYLQVFTDKTTTLKSTGFVQYNVQVVLMNRSARYPCWLVVKGYAVASFYQCM